MGKFEIVNSLKSLVKGGMSDEEVEGQRLGY
jgi:hypothetical protein